MLKSGDLRHHVTFRPDTSQDGEQFAEYDTVTLENVPCEVIDVSGGEINYGQQLEAEITHLIRCHYYEQIYTCDPHMMRIDFGDLELHIRRVVLKGPRRDEMEIQAMSVQT